MNFASLSIDYAFPDLTEKVGAVEDTSQGQEAPSAPSHLPKMSLVEPPWHVVPREEEDEEEVEEEEEEEEEEDFEAFSGDQNAAKWCYMDLVDF